MVEFKINISDTKTGKSYKKVVSETEANLFKGKKLGEKISGNSFGLSGYELQITGGSDRQGFAMRIDIDGTGRKKPLIVSGVGAKKKEKGIKQRRTIRGNIIDEHIAQINLKVVKEGSKKLEEIFAKEAPAEEKKEENA